MKIDCPVDFIKVDENKVRVTALLVLILSATFLYVGHWAIPLFLMVDFYFRGFHNGKYSLLGRIASFIADKLPLKPKPIDRAPKRFAAQTGFVVVDMLFIISIIGLQEPAFYLGCVLVVFAFLEAFLSICVGCYMYTIFKPKKMAN